MNPIDHERFELEIAAFLAGRLTDEECEALRTHIETCESCAGVVEAWAPAAAGFRIAGDRLLAPHPDSRELLRYARGETAGDDSLIEHLKTCPTCLLEVEGARTVPAAKEVRPSLKITRYVSMALAAGLVLGLGLATMLRDPGAGLALGHGATQLYTLEEAVRSSNDATVLEVDRESTVLPLVLIPAVPAGAAPDADFTIEITDGQGDTAWSSRFTAAELNRYLEVSGVLTLLVPAQPEGTYTLQLASEDGPIQEFRFEVRQR